MRATIQKDWFDYSELIIRCQLVIVFSLTSNIVKKSISFPSTVFALLRPPENIEFFNSISSSNEYAYKNKFMIISHDEKSDVILLSEILLTT